MSVELVPHTPQTETVTVPRWMTANDAENAQAARECASLDSDTDPQPGAFYGLSDTAPEPDPDHA